MGTNLTRRFVCEAMSFTHRYVPVGLLERLPTHMNERAFPYKGRDELEVRCSLTTTISIEAHFAFSRRLCLLLTRQRIGSTSLRCSSALLLMTGPSRPRYARAPSMRQSPPPPLTFRWALQHKAASTETEAQG